MRRLHSRQRSGVVSQQRLRPRRFDSTVKRVPKLRFEPVSFLFLVCFCFQRRIGRHRMAPGYDFRNLYTFPIKRSKTPLHVVKTAPGRRIARYS